MEPPVKFFFPKIFIAPKVPAWNSRGSPWEQFCASTSSFRIIVKKDTLGTKMPRLNSGIKNRNKFFAWAIFLIQKVGTNSVIYADSGDIKTLVQFPGNSILTILQNFWKCVGGVYMRGWLILKITQNVQLFTLINFIYKTRGIHLISR